MLVREAKEIIGGLSRPDKMPGPAYSVPARECKVGGKLRDKPGSVCHGCYALKGRYMFPNVQAAQYRRLDSITRPDWPAAMARAINGARWFRWHDSGDLQNVAHLAAIVEVCRATPETAHWLPTRERGILRDYVREHGPLPDNLNPRLSATMVDGPAPTMPGVNTSTVHKDKPAQGFECPAPTNGGKCGDCRACWDKTVPNVSYHAH